MHDLVFAIVAATPTPATTTLTTPGSHPVLPRRDRLHLELAVVVGAVLAQPVLRDHAEQTTGATEGAFVAAEGDTHPLDRVATAVDDAADDRTRGQIDVEAEITHLVGHFDLERGLHWSALEAADLHHVVTRLDAGELVTTVASRGVGAHSHAEQAIAITAKHGHECARNRRPGFTNDAVDPHAVLALVVHIEPREPVTLHRDGLEAHVAHELETDVVGAFVHARL